MDLLIGDIFRNAARAVPGRAAAMLGDAMLTFGELDQAANRLGRALTRLGVGRNDRVVVRAGTSLEVVPLFAAPPLWKDSRSAEVQSRIWSWVP